MGITFRHDAAAGLIGAYGAGQAAGRVRGQKYAMMSLLQQQRNLPRMLGRGPAIRARGAVGGGRAARGRAEAGPLGRWDDPLAGDVAAQRGRARKYRLGKDIPAQRQRTFTPGWKIEQDREDKLLQDKLDREDKLLDDKLDREDKLLEEGREQDVADKRTAAQVADDVRIEKGLQEGDRVLTDEAEKEIEKVRAELAKELPRVDDNQKQEAIEKTVQRINEIERYGVRRKKKDERPLAERFPEETLKLPDGTILQPSDGGWDVLIQGKANEEAVKRQKDIDKLRGEKNAAEIKLEEFDAGDSDAIPSLRQKYQDKIDHIQEQLDRFLNVPVQHKTMPPAPRAVAPVPGPADLIPPGPGVPGPDDLIPPAATPAATMAGGQLPIQGDIDARPPSPAPAAQPGAAATKLEVDTWERRVHDLNRRDEELSRDRENLDSTSQSQIDAFNLRVEENNRIRHALLKEEEKRAEQKAAAIQNDIPADFATKHSQEADILKRLGGIPAEEMSPDQIKSALEAMAVLREFKWQQKRQRTPATVDPSAPTTFDMMIR